MKNDDKEIIVIYMKEIEEKIKKMRKPKKKFKTESEKQTSVFNFKRIPFS